MKGWLAIIWLILNPVYRWVRGMLMGQTNDILQKLDPHWAGFGLYLGHWVNCESVFWPSSKWAECRPMYAQWPGMTKCKQGDLFCKWAGPGPNFWAFGLRLVLTTRPDNRLCLDKLCLWTSLFPPKGWPEMEYFASSQMSGAVQSSLSMFSPVSYKTDGLSGPDLTCLQVGAPPSRCPSLLFPSGMFPTMFWLSSQGRTFYYSRI